MTRIARLRERMLRAEHARHRVVLPADWSTADLPCSLVERKAHALRLVLQRMPVFIEEDELIVGGRTLFGPPAGSAVDAPLGLFVYPHYATEEEKAEGARRGVSEGWSKGHRVAGYGKLLRLGIGGLLAEARGRDNAYGTRGSGPEHNGCEIRCPEPAADRPSDGGGVVRPRGHPAPAGLPARATGALERREPAQPPGAMDPISVEARPTPSDIQTHAFLNAVCIAWEGVSRLALRYAALAEEMAPAAGAERAAELQRIAVVCRHVAFEVPRNFHEAVQLFWLAHVAVMVESQILMSYGRLDQLLEPFYAEADPEEAQELLECLFIKMNDQGDTKAGEGLIGGPDNVVLAGLTPDGGDATNALTYACLDALDHLRLANPQVNVRLHHGSPERLLRRACDLARQGVAQLSFYNDDAVVPALAGMGFPVEDARDWVLDACQDILVGGKSDFYTGAGVGLTEALVEALDAASPDATWEEFLEGYRTVIRERTRVLIEAHNAAEGREGIISPLPLLSATLDDCIATARDLTAGGLRFNDRGIFCMSPVNAVNSLAAIRRVVYEEQGATPAEVREACRQNFEGQEALRQRLLRAPKWGNDDDAVDAIGKEVVEFALREVLAYRTPSGGRWLPGVHQPHQVTCGKRVGATPDGRRAGEAFSITIAPVSGTDRSGPTAVIRSATKIDPMLCPWNSALTMRFHPSSVRGEEGLQKLQALLRAFLSLGGVQLQTNVVGTGILRAAQQEPSRHRDLVVRVWGFSAYFVDLSREYQEDVIARTEYLV